MVKKLNIDYVKSIIRQLGHEPLFNEYKNNNTLLKCRCKKHGIFYTRFSNIQRSFNNKTGNGCKKCALEQTGLNNKLDIEEVKDIVRQLGHEPLFDKYDNIRQKLKCKCKKHGIFYVDLIVLKRCLRNNKGNGCAKCSIDRDIERKKFTLEQARELVIELGHIPLFDEYINNDTPLLVQCIKHGKFYITLSEVTKKLKYHNGNGCKKCRDENQRILEYHDRQYIRKSYQYSHWRKEVLNFFNYICQKCGKVAKLGQHAHHIKNFASNSELRFDINNGIVLCEECHKLFHSLYGYNDNDRLQMNHFIYGD